MYFFKDSDKVKKSNSLDMQDIFVLTMTDGMKNGIFLEIGCNQPIDYNNTYILEKYFNWKGIALDYFDDFRPAWIEHRPNSIFRAMNAMKVDYESLLLSTYPGINVLDYLQLDIEPSLHTLVALKRIPFEKYKFKVITFETDVYRDGDQARNESRELLLSHGYELVAGDVVTNYYPGNLLPYEDWWVHSELVDRNIIDFFKNRSIQNPDPRYFLIKNA
jgi:hypothetical protein